MVDGVFTIPLSDFEQPNDASLPGFTSTSSAPVFFAGKENRLAAVAVHSIFAQRNCSFNPLVLCGPSGIGKTHLIRALLRHWKQARKRSRVVYQTGIEFARQYADAIETQSLDEVRRRNHRADLFALDDLGQLLNKPRVQEELVRTLDAVIGLGGQALVTLSDDPARMPKIMPSLRSRLRGGLIVPLAKPGSQTRRTILHWLAAERKIDLSADAAGLLAEWINGTVATLSGALMALHAGGAEDELIDAARCQKYLRRITKKQLPTLRAIATATARRFSLKLTDLRGPRRMRTIATARGVAMYLSRRLTDNSLQQVGEYFGRRDHTTVLHNFRKTQRLLQTDGSIRLAVEELSTSLTEPTPRKKCRG
ncbi:MAG: ATP-binding protein [Planctomycetes bacterium]|nr:ATP-binding protein [Planctomycetota bacterium]